VFLERIGDLRPQGRGRTKIGLSFGGLAASTFAEAPAIESPRIFGIQLERLVIISGRLAVIPEAEPNQASAIQGARTSGTCLSR
jgi:hypothetical protein